MIKKILVILFIFILVIVLGIAALLFFVDPNHFKSIISDTVKNKTGYELTIDGDLHWHFFPDISIITDSVRLQDHNAKKPILTANNMRLDVELLPLFSQNLAIDMVLINEAMINITNESKGDVANNKKVVYSVNNATVEEDQQQASEKANWTFDLNQFNITNSTIAYQQNDSIINFRDINVEIQQKENKKLSIDIRGAINRDQQNLIYSANANVDLAQFPDSAQIILNKLTYNYTGSDVPTGQLKGEVNATFNYQKSPLQVASDDFALTLNGNKVTGKLKANLANKPYVEGSFLSDQFDLTPFLATNSTSSINGTDNDKKVASKSTKSVSINQSTKGNELAFLQNFDAKFGLKVNKIIANKVIVQNFVMDANNKDGIASLNKINLDLANGKITANGSANGKQSVTAIKLATKATNIDFGQLLEQLELNQKIKGTFNANGQVGTNTINPERIMNALTGNFSLNLDNARIENLNIQQLIQNSIQQLQNKTVSSEQYQQYSEFHHIGADSSLANGNLSLSSLQALSATLDVTGSGRVGLTQKDIDLNLNAKLLSGWNGDSKTIQKIQNIAVPMKIYGGFDELHYRIEADKVLKNLLNSKLQDELNKLKGRFKTSDSSSSSESQSTKDMLKGFLDKLK